MLFAIYYVVLFTGVAFYFTKNGITHQTDTNSSCFNQTHATSEVLEFVQDPSALAARLERPTTMKPRAQRVTDARAQRSRREQPIRSKGRKGLLLREDVTNAP